MKIRPLQAKYPAKRRRKGISRNNSSDINDSDSYENTELGREVKGEDPSFKRLFPLSSRKKSQAIKKKILFRCIRGGQVGKEKAPDLRSWLCR